jgi:TolA-binding protein
MKAANSRIAALDLAGAEAELGNLLSGFAGHEKLGEVVHEVVEEYRDAGLYEESRGLFAYLLENWDETADTMLELQVGVALQSIKLNELDKADAAVAKLIADYNDHPKIGKGLFQIGEEYYRLQNCAKAIEIWEVIEARYADREFANRMELPYVLGSCYGRLGGYEEAIACYEQLVDQWPQWKHAAVAQVLVAECYNKLAKAGRMETAEAVEKMRDACGKVIANYGDSRAAGTAESLLREASMMELVSKLEGEKP